MSSWTRASYLAVLVVAVMANAAVLYFPVEPALRLLVGLLLIPIILWAGLRVEITRMDSDRSPWTSRGRVFRDLRSQVVVLLEHIRRLNWIAVDAERGFRDKDDAMREMDEIEDEIRGMIADVRKAAGRAHSAPETSLIRKPETAVIKEPETAAIRESETAATGEPEAEVSREPEAEVSREPETVA